MHDVTELTHDLGRSGRAATSTAEAQANAALGAILGALGMTMVTALIVAIVGASGGFRATTVSAPAPAPATAIAQVPADMAGMQHATTTASAALAAAKPVTTKAIARSATALPPAITRTSPTSVRVDLQTQEVVAEAAPGETYTYWTFNGSVPGPMIRVRVGDTVDIHVANATGSAWPHSIDLHAVNGPGGGATATQTNPGKETSVTFEALNPGLYV